MKFILVLIAILAICPFLKAKAQSCGDCEIVIGLIETWVDNNATDQQIETYLDVACATIFSAYQQTCDALVAQGVSEIIAWINQDESSQQICTQLGFCTPGSISISQTGECDTCETAVSTIEVWLDNTQNQGDVITTVEVVCTAMPAWASTCDAMVIAGVPSVINWIETYENSTTVCGQLGLCNAEVAPVKVIAPIKASTPSKGLGDECSDCQLLVTFVENWSLNNATADQIEQYLDTLCPFLPDYTQQCEQIVNSYIPQILAYLEADENPTTICTQLGACTAFKGFKKPVFLN